MRFKKTEDCRRESLMEMSGSHGIGFENVWMDWWAIRILKTLVLIGHLQTAITAVQGIPYS